MEILSYFITNVHCASNTFRWFNMPIIRSFLICSEHSRFNDRPIHCKILLGINSFKGRSSYRHTSRSLEAARLDIIMIVSLRNLTGISTAPAAEVLDKYQGWGLLKLRSLISSQAKFSILQKYLLRFPESHSYLTGVTAAELRRHLPNINAIFNR